MKARFFPGSVSIGIILTLFGCHIEQGKLHFEAVGLDPIEIYKLAPLERTVYCIAEAEVPEEFDFATHYGAALGEVLSDPKQADWSELVCLTLAEQTGPETIKQTIDALQLIISQHPDQSHPARGFVRLLEQRLDLYELIFREQQRLQEALDGLQTNRKASQEAHAELQLLMQRQREKIQELESQVRKLKEIELKLPAPQ